MIAIFLPLILATTLMSSLGAWAGTFNFIGYGATNQAMGNSTVSVPMDGFSQAYNPALMALQGDTDLSLGLQGDFTSFTPISNVLIDTTNLGGSANTFGNVDTSTESTMLMALGYQTVLMQGEHPWHVGFILLAPVNKILEVNTPDMFQPEYSMYLADTQRIVTGLSVAKALSDSFSFGVGGNLYLVQGAGTKSRLPSGGEPTARLTTNIQSGIAPMAGIVWRMSGRWNLGLSYRANQNYETEVDVDTQLNVLGPTDLIFIDSGSVQYDPDMFLLGLSYSSGVDTWAAAAKYELWSPYNGGILTMNFQTFQGSYNQTIPSINFQNIVTLHTGFQHKFSGSQISLGYAYVPTPVPDQSGQINLLDSDKHEVYGGFGFRWRSNQWKGSLKLDMVAFADVLVPKQVVKTSSSSIGAPGYNIGGTIFGYGLTGTREF